MRSGRFSPARMVSLLFTRGETQAALATTSAREQKGDKQRLDRLLFEDEAFEALHAALQFPAVLRRQSEVPFVALDGARLGTARSPSDALW